MPTVYAVCDKVALLLNGRIGEQYTIEKLKQEPDGPMFQFINGESA
jgi:phospholipid/cholesterol/gamma-HCH transport system ATP-binding protein